ncbi:MAG: hypothetical protein UX62_C0011G0001, partial [Microgenomates group bacterium GW2011_GWA2_46_7]
PWNSSQQVEIIRMIGYLDDLWKPSMSDQEVKELYQELTTIPQDPGKIEEI